MASVRGPLVLYFNGVNGARGSEPWTLIRLWLGRVGGETLGGSLVRTFGSEDEAEFFAAVSSEAVWRTRGYSYPAGGADLVFRVGAPETGTGTEIRALKAETEV